ncbi:MAG: efflux RND transporter periplasmic adaptor subunit, partial [Bacteroidetes bacterium]|nr:efflux RND transporter periplasmic adaptor subunit [Bacteroidota bacterium]
MKRKWKYNKFSTLSGVGILLPLLIGIAAAFLISSCSQQDKHKHIPTNKASELDGLVQPTNQIVFSRVRTISAIQKSITPVISATGIVSYDPRLLSTISAKFSGRIEKLYVRFNFEPISKGQRIMDIYSPEIVTAQKNLIFLLNSSSNDELINSSKQKLHLLGLTDEQLSLIDVNRRTINPLPVYSQY